MVSPMRRTIPSRLCLHVLVLVIIIVSKQWSACLLWPFKLDSGELTEVHRGQDWVEGETEVQITKEVISCPGWIFTTR